MIHSSLPNAPICNLCDGLCSHVYTPIGSRVGLELYICHSCGFFQTTKSSSSTRTNDETFRGLSCDADYSNVRVGKRQMLENSKDLLEKSLNTIGSKPRILDMAAGRGDFLKYVNMWQPSKLVGFEPDEYMVKNSEVIHFAELKFGDYRTMSRDDKFDFIYSCHSLEHFSNPSGYFDFVSSILSPSGVFFLDVPNVNDANRGLVLDEYFYDKHRVYFDSWSIDKLAAKFGLNSFIGRDQGASLLRAYQFKKGVVPSFQSRYELNLSLINDYKLRMAQNRARIPGVVSQVRGALRSHDGQTILFGAGRATNALIKYGGLDLNIFDHVVDNYLGQVSNKLFGREIATFDDLETLTNPMFVVSTKSSTAQITKLIKSKFPHARLLLLVELFDSEDLAQLR